MFLSVFPERGSCYRIAPGTLAGVVLGDIALTILIVGATYYCASKRRIKKEKGKSWKLLLLMAILPSSKCYLFVVTLTCICILSQLIKSTWMSERTAQNKEFKRMKIWQFILSYLTKKLVWSYSRFSDPNIFVLYIIQNCPVWLLHRTTVITRYICINL